jgi:hypothetical protein
VRSSWGPLPSTIAAGAAAAGAQHPSPRDPSDSQAPWRRARATPPWLLLGLACCCCLLAPFPTVFLWQPVASGLSSDSDPSLGSRQFAAGAEKASIQSEHSSRFVSCETFED